ncbi:MAG: LuxR C-terminal-related transcriptional regulator, partial [Actinophytocola sp.]|uniref:LuxR C-terminal-related transcriptional regulator n=1 Tax=Actinophytocola sp. TaxID=1872138 RepID=UPI003D6A625C
VGPAAVAGSPALALISALAHAVAGDRGLAEADLASCWAAWPATPEADLRRLRQLVVTTHALADGTAPAAVSRDWPDVLGAYEGTDLEAWARLGLGWTMLCAGEPARPELEAAERLARDHGFDFLRLHSLSALAVLSARDGAFPAMESAAAAAVELAYALGWTSSPWLSTNHLMIGFARLLCLDPVAALDEARHAEAALAADAPSRSRYLVGVLSGAACVDEGRRREGLALLRAARHDHGDASVPAPLLAAGALIEHRSTVDAGQDALAQQLAAWVRERVGNVAELGLMRARASFAHGGLEATEEMLAGRPALCPTTPLEAELLATALEIRLGRRTRARDSLYESLVRAEPVSLIRPFHDADLSVRQLLLEQVGGFGSANGFAARVSQTVSTMDARRADVLTSREHAVLVRLSSPQSLDELAVDLRVSVNTVKTHVRAIYAKLGVNNRRGAVVAGRQLGLA